MGLTADRGGGVGALGKDTFEMIGDFGGRGKILGVHFRNVSSPLPRFDLAGIREPKNIAKFPPGGQTAFKKLWDDVAALLAEAS